MKREITAREYEEIAERFTEAVDGNDYFSGSIARRDWRLACSVIVYWHTDTLGSGEKETRMEKLAWIWWGFHTYDAEGNEVLNDFKTSTLELFLGI
jgi:hypothetical protein|nr:MAG TPA: hypothetical protein [Caudoviricetes sp.]